MRGVGLPETSGTARQNPEAKVDLVTPDANREWDLHSVQFGETPIDDDVRDYLTERCRGIVTKDELNLAESENIFEAMEWLQEHPFGAPSELLNQVALRDLHRRMFEQVWTWAGQLRIRETNMGIDPLQITHEWQIALGNARMADKSTIRTHPKKCAYVCTAGCSRFTVSRMASVATHASSPTTSAESSGSGLTRLRGVGGLAKVARKNYAVNTLTR